MKKVIFLVLILLSTPSFAYFDFGLGYSLSTKNNLEQDIEMRNVMGGQMSYDWHDLNLGFELNYFSESESQAGLASTSHRYIELSPWARYNFINTDMIDIFFGVGSGGYQEKVEVTVSGAGSYSDKSEINWLLSGALGIKGKFGWFSGVVEYRISRRMAEEIQNQSLRLSTNLSF